MKNSPCDYVTAGDINPMDVIRSLKQLLMPYEFPSTYRKVKSMFRNTNGKKVIVKANIHTR